MESLSQSRELPSGTLTLSDVPQPDAEWSDIRAFAHTFNGYDAHGSFSACAAIANRRSPQNLIELRTCLFFEVRRWGRLGVRPGAEDLAYIRWLVSAIRTELVSPGAAVRT